MDKFIGAGSHADNNDNSWAITRFFSEEVFNPQKLGANIGVLYGVSAFAGAVFFLERYGDMLVQ
ncbi:hypothetical protein GGH94_001424 [Coemansia aciculifera]|uniref:Uncharacterized protein n=1 Tax=Coemansia aciculifera TaxID=417176 RepID=A0A9W8IL09_9FUNG|nr:hypothetical protein GGH94_001424 [Coemansia aciculifera]KAJ2875966.1 hypothetical protein GGH93_001171 [Coemansia aciculifera]